MVIADENGGKMSERQIVEKKCLLFLRVEEFGLPSIIAYFQRNTAVPRPVRFCCRFLQRFIYFVVFSQLNTRDWTWLAIRHQTACCPTHCTLITLFSSLSRNTAYWSGLCTSGKDISALAARGSHIFPLFPSFCFKRLKQTVYAWQK